MRLHVDKLAALFAGAEYNHTVDESKQSVILTHAYIKAGVVLRAALTLQDVAGLAVGSTENFHAEAFAF